MLSFADPSCRLQKNKETHRNTKEHQEKQDDDVFYSFVQKQKSAQGYSHHSTLFRGTSTNDMKK
jgi:hypothetical protein